MGCRTCDKPKVNYKKGLWSPEEDQKLRDYILRNGHGCWSAVPANAGLQRNGKSCRLRWINYLRPGLKHGFFSSEEEELVTKLHAMLGNKWSQIALHLPGRTDNEVKNYWNSYLKKRVAKAEGSNSLSSTSQCTDSANQNIESRPTPQENTKPTPLDSFESSSPDTRKSRSDACITGSCKATQQSSFPKVLFADWLSMDNVNGRSSTKIDSTVNYEWDSNLNMDGVPTGNPHHGFGENNFYEEFQTPYEPAVETWGGGLFDPLYPLSAAGGHFSTDDDVIY